MKHVAVLDERGVFRGRREVSDAEFTADMIEVDDALVPGRYRWTGQTFLPITPDNPVDAGPPPEALTAIALGMLASWAAGTEYPPYTLRWLDAYLTTVDMAASIDGGGHVLASEQLVRQYAIARGLTKGAQ